MFDWRNRMMNGEFQTEESERKRPKGVAHDMSEEIALAAFLFLVVEPVLIGRGIVIAAVAALFAYVAITLHQSLRMRLVSSGLQQNKVFSVGVVLLIYGSALLLFMAVNPELLHLLDLFWYPFFWGIDGAVGTLTAFGMVLKFPAWVMTVRFLLVPALPVILSPYMPLLYRQFVEIVFPMYANSRFNNLSPASIWNPFFKVSEKEAEAEPIIIQKGRPVVLEWLTERDGRKVMHRESLDILTNEQWRYLAQAVKDGAAFTEEELAGKDKPISGPDFREVKKAFIQSGRLEMIGRDKRQGYRLTEQGLADLEKWLSPIGDFD